MLNFLINPDIEFETEEVKNIIETNKVIYAISTGSSFDLNTLKKAAKIEKASGEPNRTKVARISIDQVKEIL